MEKYLISLDLDGTILFDFDTVKENLIKFIKKVNDAGHYVVINTGRPFRSAIFVYEKLGLKTPMINYNGGLIVHPYDKTFNVVDIKLDKEKLFDIYNVIKDDLRNMFCEIHDDIHVMHEDEVIRPILHETELSTTIYGDITKTVHSDPNGSIIIGKNGTGEKLVKIINSMYPEHIGSRVWKMGELDSVLEIFPTKTNKGEALKYVQKYLGIDKEHTIAIGDGHNDIEMLKAAKYGVALKNAHPELLKNADIIYDKTNLEDGVIWYLSEHLNIEVE